MIEQTEILLPIQNADGKTRIFEVAPEALDWPQLRQVWSERNVQLPLCFAPPETKLDLFFFYACQKSGMPASVGSVFNPVLTGHFLSELNHDCLIVYADLISYLTTRGLFARQFAHIRSLIVVGEPDQTYLNRLEYMYPELETDVLQDPVNALLS